MRYFLSKSLNDVPFVQHLSTFCPNVLILQTVSSNFDLSVAVFVSFMGRPLRSRTYPLVTHQCASSTLRHVNWRGWLGVVTNGLTVLPSSSVKERPCSLVCMNVSCLHNIHLVFVHKLLQCYCYLSVLSKLKSA